MGVADQSGAAIRGIEPLKVSVKVFTVGRIQRPGFCETSCGARTERYQGKENDQSESTGGVWASHMNSPKIGPGSVHDRGAG
jgi:hypothetical protein